MSMQNLTGTPNARRLAAIPVMDPLLRSPAAALARLRALPAPEIGRVRHGCVLPDLRCHDGEAGFLVQLPALSKGAA